MNWGKQHALAWGLAAFVASGLSACGGGGGGDAPTVTYTGSVAPAAVTVENQEEFASGAASAGPKAEAATHIYGVSGEDRSSAMSQRKRLDRVVGIVTGLLPQIGSSQGEEGLVGFTVASNGDLLGDCGGRAAGNGSVHGSSFTASITFSSFCDYLDIDKTERLILNGSMRVSGIFVGAIEEGNFQSIELSYDYFTVTDPSGTYTTAGTISVDVTAGETALTIRFQENGKVYQLVDYVMDGTGSVTGRLYHPDHGYVDITTIAPSLFFDDAGYPCDGALKISGATGQAKFEALGCGTFQVCLLDDGGAEVADSCGVYYW